MTILLIERVAPEAVAWLAARHRVELRPELAAAEGDLRLALYKAEAVVLPRKAVVTRDLLACAPRLKTVARVHGGTDNTDLEACRERGVRVVQASAASLRSNAEFLLASLLLLYRRSIAHVVAGQRHAEPRMGRELNGSVVGLLGLAPTAQALAPLLRGLGVRLIGYDPAVHAASPLWARLNIQPVSLRELVAQADAVSVQIVDAERYRGFINGRVLAHCKAGQLWVGLSRSSLFDPPALASALADGRIEACLLDGAEAGFASRGSPLHDADNLFLTPRLGAYTRQARLRASWYVAHRVHEALTGTLGTSLESLVGELAV